MKPLLSFCIPTFNRGKRIFETVLNLCKLPFKEIEIVVCDDASTDNTKELITSIKDQRVTYYKNEKNLGFDGNFVKCIERARGDFIFSLSDEDTVNDDSIKWVLDLLRKDQHYSQILGAIIDGRHARESYYFLPEDREYKSGPESLLKLLYNHQYLSGIILKKETLNPTIAEKFVGCFYIHQIFQGQAMMKGPTLCTSKPFAIIEKQLETQITGKNVKNKMRKFNDIFNRMITFQYFIYFIVYITKDLPKLRKWLLINQRQRFAQIIVDTLLRKSIFGSMKSLIQIIPFLLKIKELSSFISFWIDILYRLSTGFLKAKIFQKLKFLR
ncbi:MAG: glycosyltransferase family 2 protein [Promethearchaeota archaeon]